MPAYDELFECILETASTRDGEIRAARLLLTRGERQLHSDRPIEAIATLGRALGRLYKHETRHDIVRALYLCGCSYEKAGLPWAARGTLLAGASIATDDLWRYGDITPYQAACYRGLKWTELRLGRVPHVLAWHELDTAVRHVLAEKGLGPEGLLELESEFSALLGRLFLRADLSDLQALSFLPDVLDRLGLGLAADALLYALGHCERLEEAGRDLAEDPKAFAVKWRKLKMKGGLAEKPILYNGTKVLLQSQVLGCQLSFESEGCSPCVEVAESILACVESFLATSVYRRAMAREPVSSLGLFRGECTRSAALNFGVLGQIPVCQGPANAVRFAATPLTGQDLAMGAGYSGRPEEWAFRIRPWAVHSIAAVTR